MNGPTDQRACAICGRVLDYTSGKGWAHTFQDMMHEDHIAVPVTLDQISVIGRCDFCNEDFPAWEVPARDFPTLIGTMSSGAWAACDIDADLIRHNRWDALLRRIAPLAAKKNNVPPELIRATIAPLYNRLRKNITGPVRRPTNRGEGQ